MALLARSTIFAALILLQIIQSSAEDLEQEERSIADGSPKGNQDLASLFPTILVSQEGPEYPKHPDDLYEVLPPVFNNEPVQTPSIPTLSTTQQLPYSGVNDVTPSHPITNSGNDDVKLSYTNTESKDNLQYGNTSAEVSFATTERTTTPDAGSSYEDTTTESATISETSEVSTGDAEVPINVLGNIISKKNATLVKVTLIRPEFMPEVGEKIVTALPYREKVSTSTREMAGVTGNNEKPKVTIGTRRPSGVMIHSSQLRKKYQSSTSQPTVKWTNTVRPMKHNQNDAEPQFIYTQPTRRHRPRTTVKFTLPTTQKTTEENKVHTTPRTYVTREQSNFHAMPYFGMTKNEGKRGGPGNKHRPAKRPHRNSIPKSTRSPQAHMTLSTAWQPMISTERTHTKRVSKPTRKTKLQREHGSQTSRYPHINSDKKQNFPDSLLMVESPISTMENRPSAKRKAEKGKFAKISSRPMVHAKQEMTKPNEKPEMPKLITRPEMSQVMMKPVRPHLMAEPESSRDPEKPKMQEFMMKLNGPHMINTPDKIQAMKRPGQHMLITNNDMSQFMEKPHVSLQNVMKSKPKRPNLMERPDMTLMKKPNPQQTIINSEDPHMSVYMKKPDPPQSMINSHVMKQKRPSNPYTLPPHMTSKIPPHMTKKRPLHMTTKIPQRTTTKNLQYMIKEMPPHMTTKIPPHRTTKISLRMTTKMPPHMTTKMPPHMTTNVPPHRTTKMPPRRTTKMPPHRTTKMPPHRTTKMPLRMTTKTPRYTPQRTTKRMPYARPTEAYKGNHRQHFKRPMKRIRTTTTARPRYSVNKYASEGVNKQRYPTSYVVSNQSRREGR